ncbi:cupin domain-containing protein [Novosphingobium sp. BL-8A]|uniref:(R)-mandelonitrile lyase n=1 Tax=Novosphingobium sp. BL-8A TaxID=3127639 RepID=UPI00375734B1
MALRLAGAVTIAAVCIATPVAAQTADTRISRDGERSATPGPSKNFTGSVSARPLFPAAPPSTVSAGEVTFQPGARSNWHRHPMGQHLIVTAGRGWTQVEGGSVVEMRPGDVIWCPPGVKHWHGASPDQGVTHIAIQETVDGTNVEWLEPVTATQYRR